jgi:hypothetical protein
MTDEKLPVVIEGAAVGIGSAEHAAMVAWQDEYHDARADYNAANKRVSAAKKAKLAAEKAYIDTIKQAVLVLLDDDVEIKAIAERFDVYSPVIITIGYERERERAEIARQQYQAEQDRLEAERQARIEVQRRLQIEMAARIEAEVWATKQDLCGQPRDPLLPVIVTDHVNKRTFEFIIPKKVP